MIGVVLIVLVLCLSIGYSKAANTVTSSNIQTYNGGDIGSNSSSPMNYTYVVNDWRREVTIDAWGGISVVDQCSVTNNANGSINIVRFILPANASVISVQDPFGAYESYSTTGGMNTVNYVTYVEVDAYLRNVLTPQQRVRLLVEYTLPSNNYLFQRSWQDYTLNINLNKSADWFVEQFTLAVFLPGGARYQAASKTPYNIQESVFSTSIEFVETNVTQISEPTITLQYQYFILWAAFRPALWTGTAVAIFAVVFFARRVVKPSAEVVAAVPFSLNLLKNFVNRYGERRRLRLELETMEEQVEKGKLSRRIYRLRKNSIDDHLSRLNRELLELRKQIATAGGQYSEWMRRLESAEAEIETWKKDIERAEARFLRREITIDARRKLLDEYSRIKERAENTIEETLLRLREEIR
jgi:hypothetical protein